MSLFAAFVLAGLHAASGVRHDESESAKTEEMVEDPIKAMCAACTWFWPHFFEGLAYEEWEDTIAFAEETANGETAKKLMDRCPVAAGKGNCERVLSDYEYSVGYCHSERHPQSFCGCLVAFRHADGFVPGTIPVCPVSEQMKEEEAELPDVWEPDQEDKDLCSMCAYHWPHFSKSVELEAGAERLRTISSAVDQVKDSAKCLQDEAVCKELMSEYSWNAGPCIDDLTQWKGDKRDAFCGCITVRNRKREYLREDKAFPTCPPVQQKELAMCSLCADHWAEFSKGMEIEDSVQRLRSITAVGDLVMKSLRCKWTKASCKDFVGKLQQNAGPCVDKLTEWKGDRRDAFCSCITLQSQHREYLPEDEGFPMCPPQQEKNAA